MINNKEDYQFYLKEDKRMLGYESQTRPRMFTDEVWKFQRLLRQLEYYTNCHQNRKLRIAFIKLRFHHMSIKLGFTVPLNVFGPGLSIAHWGSLVVNANAKVGRNCRIQNDVVIGATYSSNRYPVIGDNCYIGSGAKIIGGVTIGNNVAIGSNAVVTKSFGDNVTLGGVPAYVISNNGSLGYYDVLRKNKR